MKATAELKMLPVSVLKPAAYNPRKKLKPGDKEYEKIKNSITEFGFADPLVVNADMTIIGGTDFLSSPDTMIITGSASASPVTPPFSHQTSPYRSIFRITKGRIR